MAILFWVGNIPSVNEVLQISVRGILILFFAILSNLVGIALGPDDFESSSLFIISVISAGFVGEIKKESIVRFFK